MLRKSLRHHFQRIINGSARRQKRRKSVYRTTESMEPRQLLTTLFWDGGGDGTSWGDAANWMDDSGADPSAAPGGTDHAIIDQTGAAYTVRLTASTTVEQVTINSPNVDLEIRNFDLNVVQSMHIQDVNAFRLENATLSAPVLVNDSVITARGTAIIDSTQFTSNDRLNVFSSSGTGHAQLTVTSGLVNNGLISFLINGGRNATLAVDSGVLLNQSSGEIHVNSGSGSGFLLGDVDNFGTINFNDDSSNFNRSGAVLNNHGTINVASTGRLFGTNAVINQIAGILTNERDVRLDNNGTLNFSGGVIQNNAGSGEIFHVQHVTMSGGQHNGAPIVITNGSLDLNVTGANDAAFQLRQSNTVSGTVPEGMTVRALKQPGLASTTTFAAGFTNSGLLLFDRSSTTDNTASVATGEINNTATGVIRLDNKVDFNNANISSGGLVEVNADSRHRLSGTFTNTGDIVVDAAARWQAGVGATSIHSGGLITNHGDFRVFGTMILNADIVNNGMFDVPVGGTNPPGELRFQSGTISGNSVVIDGGRLSVQGTDPNTFVVQSALSSSELSGTLAAGQTLIAVSKGTTPPVLNIAEGTTIAGSVVIDSSGAGSSARLQSTGSAPVQIQPTGSVTFDGSTRDILVTASLDNHGTLEINGRPSLQAGTVLRNFGQINVNPGSDWKSSTSAAVDLFGGSVTVDPAAAVRLSAPVRYLGGNVDGLVGIRRLLEIDDHAGNSGTFVMEDGSHIAGSIQAGQTVVLQSGIVTVDGDLNNSGTIVFSNPSGGSLRTELELNQGLLTNNADGTVRVQTGGDTLAFLHEANVVNAGAIHVDSGRFGYSGFLTNQGDITIDAGASFRVTQVGSEFYQEDGLLDVADRFSFSATQFVYNGGEIDGVVDLQDTTLSFGDRTAGSSTFLLTGSNTLDGDVPAGVTLQLESQTPGILTRLTSNQSFSNHGVIQLGTAVSAGNLDLIVNGSRTITNAADGIITVDGAGGTRNLLASLNNQGTLASSVNWNLGRTGTSTEFHRNRGVMVTDGTVNIRGLSFLNESGGVVEASGTWNLNSTAFTSSGIFSPGGRANASSWAINGNVTLTSLSEIQCDLGGTQAGAEFDQINVSGVADLGGILHCELTDGFVPTIGDSHLIVTYSTATSDFDAITGLDSGVTNVYAAFIDPESVRLECVTAGFDLSSSFDSGSPATVTSGQPVTISYTTINLGQPIVAGTWKDRLYISTSPVFDARLAFLVTEVERTCDLETGEQCANNVTAAVPGVNPGRYFWHLLTDVSQQVPDVNRTNNFTTSTGSTLVDSEPMFVGETTSGTIAAGQNFYFRLELTEAQATQLTATTSTANAIRVFISEDEMPSNWNFDYESTATDSTTRTHNFSDTRPRTYFVHLRALPAAAAGTDYSLSWQSLPLSITNVSSGKGSNLGTSSVLLSGTAFTRDTTAQLIDSQGAIVREAAVFFVDSETLQVTVDLTDVPAGFYGWQVLDAGSSAQCGGDCYEVGSFALGALNVSINPADSRVGIPAPVTVTWTNTGNTDVASPFFILRAENALVGFEDCTDASCMNTSLVFFGGSSTGRVDLVRPGETVTARFTYMTSNADPFTLTCSITDESTPLPDRFLESLLTDSFTREQQNQLIDILENIGVGDTTGSFQDALRTVAANLKSIGIPSLNDIGSLTSALLNQFNQSGKLTTLATGTAASDDFTVFEIVNNCVLEGESGQVLIRGEGFRQSFGGLGDGHTVTFLTDARTGQRFDPQILLIEQSSSLIKFDVSAVYKLLSTDPRETEFGPLPAGVYNITVQILDEHGEFIAETSIQHGIQVKPTATSSPLSLLSVTAIGGSADLQVSTIVEASTPNEFLVRGDGFGASLDINLRQSDGSVVIVPFEVESSEQARISIPANLPFGSYGISINNDLANVLIAEALASDTTGIRLPDGRQVLPIVSIERHPDAPDELSITQIINNCVLAGSGGIVIFRGTGFTEDMEFSAVNGVPGILGTFEFVSSNEIRLHVDPTLGGTSDAFHPILVSSAESGHIQLLQVNNGLIIKPTLTGISTLRVSSPASFGRGTRDITQFRLTNAGDRFIATIGGSDVTLVKDSAGRFVSLSPELIPVRETETEITVVSGDDETTFDKTTGEFKRQRNRNSGRTLAPVFFDTTLGLIAGTVDEQGNPATQFQRDKNGNVISRIDDDGETSFEYDSQNRVERVTTPDGVATTFTRSPEQQFADLVTGISNSLDQSFELLYDELNQLRQILNVNTGERFTLERNEAGFLSNVLDGSGAPILGNPPADAVNVASSITQSAVNEIASTTTMGVSAANDFVQEHMTPYVEMAVNEASQLAEMARRNLPQGVQNFIDGKTDLQKQASGVLGQLTGQVRSAAGSVLNFIRSYGNQVAEFYFGSDEEIVAVSTGRSLQAVDPNDILGPAGVGDGRHLTVEESLDYTIRFENMADATAPAQNVFITQTLDADLDFNTYQLEEFGFGGLRFDVPEGKNSFRTLVDLREEHGVLVRVSADIDQVTGIIRWILETQDPETGASPADPLAGFLPPNVIPGDGEGFVRYSIRPKADLVSGDRLDAEASIIFDVNEAISTPPIFNTIDAAAPVAIMNALPHSVPTDTFTISWSGSDEPGGAGLAFYDVFVSEDGEEFELLMERTTATSVEFTGQSGSNYRFIAVATDRVGNRQEFPAAVQAETTVETAEGVAVLLDGNLIIIGTSRNDRIQILPDRRHDSTVKVKLNGRNLGRFTPTGRIRVDALAGNDRVTIDSRIEIHATIDGGEGNDRLDAGGGNDILIGGPGNDRLTARAGDNQLFGGDGEDELTAGRGNDELFGEHGNDVLRGDRGADRLDGGPGSDVIFAGRDGSTVFGGEGDDVIHGGAGNDFVDAGAGNDQVFDDRGDDILLGGDGNDLIVDLRGNNILLGGSGSDTIRGGLGRDLIIGGTGSDRLFGGRDEDILIGGSTDFDDDPQALKLLLSEWTRHTPRQQRKQNIVNGTGKLEGTGIRLAPQTVQDDNDRDLLFSRCDLDLVFSGVLDVLLD